MEPFTTHTGRALPLRRSNVDTDQIIPAEYLKRVTRTGFGEGLFAAWREDPAFVLNDPAYAGATIVLAGPDFGIGSSREHAVWALQDYGFRVVVASRFGDIFAGNATKAGLLPVQLPEEVVKALHDAVEADPGTEITIDLDARDRSRELLERVGLEGRFDHYPVQLSGGEQQRVALARAFALRPPILLADEPTGNLDSATGKVVLDLLLAMNREQGATLVLVTHEQSLAECADRRIVLRDGLVVSQ